jgi:hypothetical protein
LKIANTLDFAGEARRGGRLRKVFLVHGEPGPQKAITDLLGKSGFSTTYAPAPGHRSDV